MPRLCKLDGFVRGAGLIRDSFFGAYYTLVSREFFLPLDYVTGIKSPPVSRPIFIPTTMLNYRSANSSLVTFDDPADEFGKNTFGKLLDYIRDLWADYPDNYYFDTDIYGFVTEQSFETLPPADRSGALYYSAAASTLTDTSGYILAAVIERSGIFYYAWTILANYQRMDWGFEFDDTGFGGGGDPTSPSAPLIVPLKAFRRLSSATSIIVNGETVIGYTGTNYIELKITSAMGTPAQRKVRLTQTNISGTEITSEYVEAFGSGYTTDNIIQIQKNGNFNKLIAKVEIADDYGFGFGVFGEIDLKFLASINTENNNDTFYVPYSTIESLYASGNYANGDWIFSFDGTNVIGYPG